MNLVSDYHFFDVPYITTIDIAFAKQSKLYIPKLVEYKQGMITGISEMAIVSRSFLFAKGRAVRTVHVEDDLFYRLS